MVTKNPAKKELSVDEIRKKLKNHLLWLRGSGKESDKDFSDIRFIVDKYDTLGIKGIFDNTNLTNANFQNSIIKGGFMFKNTIVDGMDLRGAEYDVDQFTPNQLSKMILTDEDFKKYEEMKKLKEKNKVLAKEVENKDDILKSVGKEQTNELLSGFEKLRIEFFYEERMWLSMAFIIFICLLFVALIPLFDIFAYQYTYKLIFWGFILNFGLIILLVVAIGNSVIEEKKDKQKFWYFFWNGIKKSWLFILYGLFTFYVLKIFINSVEAPNERVFNISIQYGLFPVSVLFLTFLYFSVYQYSKAKTLRIENQNKIAIIHGFQAIKADIGGGIDKRIFYSNTANIIFTKAFESKKHVSNDLPVDKIFDLAKEIAKIKNN